MNLLNIIKKEKNKKFLGLFSGNSIILKIKQEINKNKTQIVDGLIIAVKKKKKPTITILKKINNIIFKKIIKMDSPLIDSYKIIKNKKGGKKKSKLYNLFKKN